MKICFIGLDGSGKSTQSNILLKKMQRRNLDAVYRHQFRYESEKVMSAKDKLRPLIKRMQFLMCIPDSIMIESRLLTLVRDNVLWRFFRPLFVYPIGIIVLYSGLIKAKGKSKLYGQHDYFIMDRCFLDELARVEWKLNIKISFRNLWLNSAPSPDITFYFDIPGEVSWQRMDPQDTGKKAMKKKEETYKKLLPLYSDFTDLNIININGMTIEQVTEKLQIIISNKDENLNSIHES